MFRCYPINQMFCTPRMKYMDTPLASSAAAAFSPPPCVGTRTCLHFVLEPDSLLDRYIDGPVTC